MGDLLTVSHLRSATPHPALAAHVRQYVQVDDHGAGSIILAALPCPLLLVTWGAPVTLATSETAARPLPLVVLTGPTSRVHRSEIGAGACGFHVRFTPTGARALLGERPDADCWDAGVSMAVTRWAEAVVETSSFDVRVALTDAFLRGLVARPVWSDAAVRAVAAARGAAPVASVAAALGVSARTLRRRFADDVGIGVKVFAQIERYRQTHGFLLRTPRASWREACAGFGYADQAHFVREFHRFSGAPPSQWKDQNRGFDLGFGLRDEGRRSP